MLIPNVGVADPKKQTWISDSPTQNSDAKLESSLIGTAISRCPLFCRIRQSGTARYANRSSDFALVFDN